MIKNPFAGRYVEDIIGFSDDLKPLGLDLANALIAAPGRGPKTIQGYGKGAIVGVAGEIEHGALWRNRSDFFSILLGLPPGDSIAGEG